MLTKYTPPALCAYSSQSSLKMSVPIVVVVVIVVSASFDIAISNGLFLSTAWALLAQKAFIILVQSS